MSRVNLILTAVPVLLVPVLLATPTRAGDCVAYRPAVYQPPVYIQPAFVQPHAVPASHFATVSPVVAVFEKVFIPTFSAVFDPRIVPYGAPTVGGVPGGQPAQTEVSVPAEQPQVQQQAGQPQVQPSSGNEVLDLLRQMSARLDRLESAQGAPTSAFDFGGPPPRSPLPYTPPVTSRPVSRSGRDAVMLARCASCHDDSTAGSKGGGVTLTRGGRVVQMSAQLSAQADQAVASGAMPKGRPLSDSERRQFLASPAGLALQR